VGESGCGKSVTALSIMRLVPDPPGKIVEGTIKFEGRNILELNDPAMREIRGNDISMIFQEPMTSLNPVFTVVDLPRYCDGFICTTHRRLGHIEAHRHGTHKRGVAQSHQRKTA